MLNFVGVFLPFPGLRCVLRVEGCRTLENFSASGGGSEEILFGGGVVGEGGAAGAWGVGDQVEVTATVEVRVGFCEEEFCGGNDVRVRGYAGDPGTRVRGVLFIGVRRRVWRFGAIAAAARGADRCAAAAHGRHCPARVRWAAARRRTVVVVVGVVSRAHELCIPFRRAASQIFEVSDWKIDAVVTAGCFGVHQLGDPGMIRYLRPIKETEIVRW